MVWKGKNYLRKSDRPKQKRFKSNAEDIFNQLDKWYRVDFDTEDYIAGRNEFSAIAEEEFERHLKRMNDSKNKPSVVKEPNWY